MIQRSLIVNGITAKKNFSSFLLFGIFKKEKFRLFSMERFFIEMTFFDVGMCEDTREVHLLQKRGTEIFTGFLTKFPKLHT